MVIASIGEMLGFAKGMLVDFVVRKVKKMVPPWRLPGHIRFRTRWRKARARRTSRWR